MELMSGSEATDGVNRGVAPGLLEEELSIQNPEREAGYRRGIRLFFVVAGGGGSAVGLFVLALGLFFWPTNALYPSIVPILLGSLVLVGTVWGAWLLRRTIQGRLVSFTLTTEGVRGATAGGSRLSAAWSDPDFAVDVTLASGPAPWAQNRHSLRWAQFSGAYAREVTDGGFQHLLEAAKSHGLVVIQKRRTSGQFEITDWRIRSS